MARAPHPLADALAATGYVPRREELLALAGALSAPAGQGARALLLEGPPGCGKSALAEATARAKEAPLVVYQAHAWSDDSELFVGVDVAAAVAGDAASVRQPGVLARVAQLAEEHPLVVVLLDEIDKAPERTEALLLDWLQSGRVPVRPGVQLRTRLEHVLVVLTSNGIRPLGDALLRRCRRVQMQPLPRETQARLVAERSGCTPGVATLLVRLAGVVGETQRAVVSLQECARCANELSLAESCEDAVSIARGWLARSDAGRAAITPKSVAALWAEVHAARRERW